mgnify:CR=1 FL=1
MIRLSNIKKTFQGPKGPVEALKGIDIHVEPGEIFGIVGFEVHFDDVILRDATFNEVFLEEIKQKITFPTTPHTSEDFYKSVMLGLNKSVGQGRSVYFNRIHSIFVFMDLSKKFDLRILYQSFRRRSTVYLNLIGFIQKDAGCCF